MFVDTPTLQIAQWDGGVTLDTANSVVLGAISRGGDRLRERRANVVSMAARSRPTSLTSARCFPMTTTGIGFLTLDQLRTTWYAGYIRRVSYWPARAVLTAPRCSR